ncbi:hypothetical protein C8R45DRAFT_1219528 [Mycena sanguinolenta]|nr:hypothetical protein C8R45DRAFT_1219528 [Mycena sanguinolenta]
MAARQTPSEQHTYQTLRAGDASSALTRTADDGVPPVYRRSLVTGMDAHRPSNCPSSTPDISAPSIHSNTRKRHRNRRRSKPSSQTSVADAPNIPKDGSHHKRTQTNSDSDRPAKRARKAASFPDDGPAVGIRESPANTGFSRRRTSTDAAGELDTCRNFFNSGEGSRASASSTRPGKNDSQVDVKANQPAESPYVSFTGAVGGAGGPGGIMGVGGSGGNATGPVIKVKNWNCYFQR